MVTEVTFVGNNGQLAHIIIPHFVKEINFKAVDDDKRVAYLARVVTGYYNRKAEPEVLETIILNNQHY
jgi:hypothetical protein